MDHTRPGVSFDIPASPVPPHRSSIVDTSKLSLPYTSDPPSAANPPEPKVWIIFGATGHFGRSVMRAALSHGDMVTAVGQTLQDDLASVEKWYSDPEHYLGLLCDIRIRSTVATVMDKTMQHFGKIDIIANCSGYGVIGACEDQDEHEIRNQFEVNFMGTLNMIQLSLPYFRRRQEGRYLIFSSTSGALGVPGLGPYCATKYAVEGLVESMLYEVDPFNIKVSLVEPGHLRRDDVDIFSPPILQYQQSTASNSTITATNGQPSKASSLPLFGHFKIARPSSPYATKDSPAAHTQRTLQWLGSNQPTSVVKAAELVWQLGHCRYPPLRLLLGSFAIDSIRDRLKSIIEEIEDWKHLSFPPLEGFEEKEEGEDDEQDDENDQGEEQAGGPADEDTDLAIVDAGPDRKETNAEGREGGSQEHTPIKMETRIDLGE